MFPLLCNHERELDRPQCIGFKVNCATRPVIDCHSPTLFFVTLNMEHHRTQTHPNAIYSCSFHFDFYHFLSFMEFIGMFSYLFSIVCSASPPPRQTAHALHHMSGRLDPSNKKQWLSTNDSPRPTVGKSIHKDTISTYTDWI